MKSKSWVIFVKRQECDPYILINFALVKLKNATNILNIPSASNSEESGRLLDSDILERKRGRGCNSCSPGLLRRGNEL